MRSALAGAAFGGLMLGVVRTSPAAAAGPTLFADSVCTTNSPYGIALRGTGFPPNETLNALVVFYRRTGNSAFNVTVAVDANGNAAGPDPFQETEPFRYGILFFRDRDASGTYTSGDDLVADLIVSIDKSCTGAEGHPK